MKVHAHLKFEKHSKFMRMVRVPTAPGKPGILTFIFPDMEKSWN